MVFCLVLINFATLAFVLENNNFLSAGVKPLALKYKTSSASVYKSLYWFVEILAEAFAILSISFASLNKTLKVPIVALPINL